MYTTAEKRYRTAYKRAVRIRRIRQIARRVLLLAVVTAAGYLLCRQLSDKADIRHTQQVALKQSALDRKKQSVSDRALAEAVSSPQDDAAAPQSSADSVPGPLCPALKEPELFLQNPELPTGCEATSGAMLLTAYGYQTNKCTVADALSKHTLIYTDDSVYAPHPNDAFIGNPYSSDGYGTFPDVLADALQSVIDRQGGSHTATPLYDKSEEELLSYLDEGVFLCVWSSMYDMEITYDSGWKLLHDGEYTDEYFFWPSNEHVLLLTGYDEENVTVLDPLVGKCSYPRASFFRHYKQAGSYALMLN